MLRSIQVSIGGIPLLYAGDEHGMLNDYTFLSDPAKSKDSRWVHRSRKKWHAHDDLTDTNTLEWKFFSEMAKLFSLRKQTPAFRNGGMEIVDSGNPHLFAYTRTNGGQRLLVVNNFSEFEQTMSGDRLAAAGLTSDARRLYFDETLPVGDDLVLDAYRFAWIELSPPSNG
jgi:amylosucrase